ncbi:REJ domain protein (macronuclear) [Tetrahymena thermophila SB210]|uniref:REJ domain protein n=1 Tax=Tetrahymena thermophila (strain SB210) TaxID=312017 RepID=W7X824_TETTS|nr:REJ domain protein [Tetrahymena thermophila SB210]EWS73492.1 REJ domain protein [Tetrahymena thermophila SB210]|eukprot:XP_012653974.1 REJ domain protein [Tetrahymena thermophila SB210]
MLIILYVYLFLGILSLAKSLDYIKMPQVEINQLNLLTDQVLSLVNPKSAQSKSFTFNFGVEFTNVPQILFSVTHADLQLNPVASVSFLVTLDSISTTSFSITVSKINDEILKGLHVQYLAINNQNAYVINVKFDFYTLQQNKSNGWIKAQKTYNYQRSNFDQSQWEVSITVFIKGVDKVMEPKSKLSTQFFHGVYQVVQSTNSFDIIFNSPDTQNARDQHFIYFNYLEFYKRKNNNYFSIQTQVDDSSNPTNSTNPLFNNATPGNRTSITPIYNVNVNNLKAIMYGLSGFKVRYDNFFRLELTGPQLNYDPVQQQYQFYYQYNTWFNTQILFVQSQFVVLSQINCNQNNTLFLDDLQSCVSKCALGYYQTTTNDPVLGTINYCGKCDPSCIYCSGRSISDCLRCPQGQYFYNAICHDNCPNGYLKNIQTQNCDTCSDYDNPDCFSCNKNCFQCDLSDANFCTSCNTQTKYLDSDNTCKCLNQKDQRNNFFQCSYNDNAVTNYFLSETPRQLVVDFGFPIQSLSKYSNTPQALCEYIFTPKAVDAMGPNPDCSIQQNYIVVNLDDSSTLTGPQIQFQQPKLQFVNAISPISQYYIFRSTQNFCLNSTVNFLYNPIQSTCDPLTIQFKNITGDEGRIFVSFNWTLIQINGTISDQELQRINQVLQQANTNNSTSLEISPSLLPPNINIKLQFNFQLRKNCQKQTLIDIFYQQKKFIITNYLQSVYPPIYRYMSLSFFFEFYIGKCEYGIKYYLREPFKLQIISPTFLDIQQTIDNYNQTNFEVDIPAYSLPSNQTFSFNLQLSLISDSQIQNTQTVSVDVLITQLFVMLQGGRNQIISYQKLYSLNSIYRDYEIQDSNADQKINFNWICENLLTPDKKCYDYNNKLITFEQGKSSISIPKKTFKPYTIIQFTLQISKDLRNSTEYAICYFSEFDIPPLLVKTPIYQMNQQFNLNEDLFFTLVYDSSVSTNILSYAGAILYNNTVVAAIKFDYYQVKFRIWNYFQDIDPTLNSIQIRFSVYNPSYVMPSISTIDLLINIPPKNCVLTIDPQYGIALQTKFLIQFTNCQDTDLPLTYQYFYYNSVDDYNQEIVSPWNIVRRQLSDQVVSQQFQTILPQGNLLVLSQVMDSRLGVSNSTLSINVYSQNLTDSNYHQQVNQLIQQNLQNYLTTTNLVSNLCVIGEDVTKNIQYYNSQQINDLKQNLITNLQLFSQQIPKSSLIATYANKVIAQLQYSIFQQPDLQKSSVYNYIQQTIQKTQANKQSNNINKLQQNNDLYTQNLIDSFRILNSTVTLNTNNKFDDLMQYNNISNEIASLISNNMIPNEGNLEIQGNLSNILSDSITEKNLKQYVLPNDDSQFSLNSTNTYVIARNNYQQNIYESTSSFQAYVNILNKQNGNKGYSKNKLIVTSINNTQANGPISNSTIIYQFKNVNVSNNSNMTCLQQADTIWTNLNCGVLNQDSKDYACFCKKQSPTTIIDNIEAVFTQNENLKTAFGEQGAKNIARFSDFYQYVCVWALFAFTIGQIVLFLVGRQLDLKTISKMDQKNSQNQINNILVQKNLQQELLQDKIQNLEKQINQYSQLQQGKETKSKKIKIQKIYPQSNSNSLKIIKQVSPSQIFDLQLSNYKEDDFNLQQPHNQDQLISNRKSNTKQQENNQAISPDLKQPNNSDILKELFQENISPYQVQYTQKSNDQENDFKTETQELVIESLQNIKQQTNNKILNFYKSNKLLQFEKKQQIQQQQQQQQQSSSLSFKSEKSKSEYSTKQETACQITEPSQLDLNISESEKNYLQLNFVRKVIIFHQLIGIFYTYDPIISRSVRFSLFYLKIVHQIAISLVFYQFSLIDQKIVIAIVNAVLIEIFSFVIQFSYQIGKIGKYFSTIFSILVLLLYFYVILAISSGQTAEDSNISFLLFLMTIGLNLTLVQVSLSLFLIYISFKHINNQKNIIIIKIFNLFSIEQIIKNLDF